MNFVEEIANERHDNKRRMYITLVSVSVFDNVLPAKRYRATGIAYRQDLKVLYPRGNMGILNAVTRRMRHVDHILLRKNS